ncbi:peptide deformylase [Helicobacter sp. 11S02596-1]|uniref:peptide deformylase n=1 Tax=Helicobacter sp. 11S02596-1 TaxID=1476194 RepID=UPI000BA67DD5|nr:peptide deformylase [Helicobacter sp. 11S02596-1]PAF43592.1 peptide deformylase [Helicobacter sp. 11S02596-1]
MAILEILKYPHPTLRKKSQEVTAFDEDLHRLLDNMYETMCSRNGVGLAAIQVGVQKRVLIIEIPTEEDDPKNDTQTNRTQTNHTQTQTIAESKKNFFEIINPVFLKKEGNLKWNEGCLSVPEFYEEVDRFESVTLAFQDRFGEKKILQAQGLLSIAIQHEIDHLNGILFVDKLPILKRKKFEKELKRIQKESK